MVWWTVSPGAHVYVNNVDVGVAETDQIVRGHRVPQPPSPGIRVKARNMYAEGEDTSTPVNDWTADD